MGVPTEAPGQDHVVPVDPGGSQSDGLSEGGGELLDLRG